MTPAIERVSALARRLIAIPSASPDPAAETACARALAAALPAGLERGEWLTADGRPVVWGLLRGGSARTVILLGHYDTVGFGTYAAIGAERIACDPQALAPVLDRHARQGGAKPGSAILADLDEERASPGTWLFGRGALDMKSGLAAGVAALEDLAGSAAQIGGSVLFVATPDEEHLSEGMKTATTRLARLSETEGLDLEGAINLDYCLEPALYAGVGGKLQLGCYVLGEASHVADPGRGMNALEIAARVVTALCPGGAESVAGFAPDARPAALRLDDLESGYSIEPPTEALVEFSVPFHETTLEETLARCRDLVALSFGDAPPTKGRGAGTSEERYGGGAGGGRSGDVSAPRPARPVHVVLVPELAERAAGAAEARASTAAAGADARAATLDRLRTLCRAASLAAPAVVLHLLPPFYPPSSASGRFATTATVWAAAQGIAVRGRYPFISDASYLAWRGASGAAIARHFPSLGIEYTLPIDDARVLDLDVVNLGPWGRDAHRLFERVHAPYAFGRLPGLIAGLVREVLQ